MSEVTHCTAHGNAMGIVGAAHLLGLLKDTSLPENFHVIAINASGYDKKQNESFKLLRDSNLSAYGEDDLYQFECRDFLLSKKILQATVFPSDLAVSIIAPAKALELVNNIHLSHTTSIAPEHTLPDSPNQLVFSNSLTIEKSEKTKPSKRRNRDDSEKSEEPSAKKSKGGKPRS